MPNPNALTFHYEKSPYFRVIYADGVHGGFAPTGDALNIALWSTRKPLPTSVTHTFVPRPDAPNAGNLGPEVSRQVRDGMEREVEAMVTMPASSVVDFFLWLGKNLHDRGVPVEQALRMALGSGDADKTASS